jgi:hypothetical protein
MTIKPGWGAPHVHAVPLGGHPPAGALPAGVGELDLLAATVVAGVMITEHDVARAVVDRFQDSTLQMGFSASRSLLASLRHRIVNRKYARQDSNLQPSVPKTDALSN